MPGIVVTDQPIRPDTRMDGQHPFPMTRSSTLDRSRGSSRLTAGASYEGKRMRSASIKRVVQATALGNLCAAKQDFKPRSELGFLPVENGQTGLSAPKIEAPDLMRLPWARE